MLSKIFLLLASILLLSGCSELFSNPPQQNFEEDNVPDVIEPTVVKEWILVDQAASHQLAKVTLSRVVYTQAILTIEPLDFLEQGVFTFQMPRCLQFLPFDETPFVLIPEFQLQRKSVGEIVEFHIKGYEEIGQDCNHTGHIRYEVGGSVFGAQGNLFFDWSKIFIDLDNEIILAHQEIRGKVSGRHLATLTVFKESDAALSVLIDVVERLKEIELDFELPECILEEFFEGQPKWISEGLIENKYLWTFRWSRIFDECQGASAIKYAVYSRNSQSLGEIEFFWD